MVVEGESIYLTFFCAHYNFKFQGGYKYVFRDTIKPDFKGNILI